MKEHKLQYRDSEDKTNGCIHQLSKYAGTLVRRQLCPHLKLRAKKSEVDAEGKKVRRRNVNNNFDEKINVRENTVSDLTNVSQKNIDKPVEKNTPTTPVVPGKSVIDEVESYKGKIRDYVIRYREMNGNYFNLTQLEEVSNASNTFLLFII